VNHIYLHITFYLISSTHFSSKISESGRLEIYFFTSVYHWVWGGEIFLILEGIKQAYL